MMEQAVDSVSEDGIGCTSQLEHALHVESQAMCLEMMRELVTSESSLRDDYAREAAERNGGRHEKHVFCLFGDLGPIPRTYYWKKESVEGNVVKTGHYPWDERMGLLRQYTPALVGEVLRLSAIHNYEEASAEFSRTHGFSLSADAIRDIALDSAEDAARFHALSESVEEDMRQNLVYVLGDGTGISMFKRHLEGVRGKNGEAKTREVKLAAFFTGRMRFGKPWRNEDSTTYVATTARWEDFGRMARREFDRRFPHKPVTTVFLTDGGKWLRSVHDNFFPFAVMILDLFHALEHLREIMKLLGLKEDTDAWRDTFRKWRRSIRDGKIKSVIRKIRSMETAKNRDAVEKKLNYYIENMDRMHYDEYTDNRWFVGSGVVESGCKCVVQQRLDLSGMHWSVKGAEAVLPIRSLYKSGRLDEYLNWRVRNLDQVAFTRAA